MSDYTSQREPFTALSTSASRSSEGWPEGPATSVTPPRSRHGAGRYLLVYGLSLLVLGGVFAALAYWATGSLSLSSFFGDEKPTSKEAAPTSAEDKAEKEKAPPPNVTRKEIAKNVFLETQGEQRRVVVVSTVCLRRGEYQLEGLLTKKGTKEHEYILTAEADGIMIHAALLAAGAEAGSPVKFQPKYEPARGTVIKISLRYEKDGKTVTVSAREWVRNSKTKKDLEQDWVFGGSQLFKDPDDPKKAFYLANQGDFICVCNQDSAMLDLPVMSSKNPDDRIYEANTERIPAIGTRVEVIFEPVLKK